MSLAHFMIPVMNVALVMGVAFVVPMAFRVRWRGALVAAAGVGLSLSLPPGAPAALCLAPWVALCVVVGVQALVARAWSLAIIAGFGGTAALALVASRLEVTAFDIPEPIVKLTALHFTFAGVGTLSLAARLLEVRATAFSRITMALVMVAPPIVAAGFVTRLAALQVGGAIVMTAGVWCVAIAQLRYSRSVRSERWLFALSSASPWAAMALGVAWAANQYWPRVPALTVPDMVPTHGALNAFGFVMLGHLAWWRHQKADGGGPRKG